MKKGKTTANWKFLREKITDKKILERDRFQSHRHLSNFEFGNISAITH